MITLEMAKNTPVARKLLQYRVDLLSPKHSYLSTFLLQERCNPDSFWRPYLDVLPKNYTNFPIFYSPEDLDWLTGSPFQSKAFGTNLRRISAREAPGHFQGLS